MLRRIGHWGTGETGRFPDPRELAGFDWDEREREDIEDYLSRGFVSSASLGRERCRLCKVETGSLELTDGVFCWPEGLLHYVRQHSVWLPREFVRHALSESARLMQIETDDRWWIGAAADSSR